MSTPRTDVAAQRPTIPLIRKLCAALADGRVRYCHFKSNAYLDRSRTGENDLDLLIARADESRFAAVLHHLGFKLAWRPQGRLPGVLDYYGYDAESARVVHVHAHFQLIAGDDFTKNYRIPLEGAFLDAAREHGEFYVPPPELELLLLVIRLAIKHLTWDAVLTRRSRVPPSARVELDFLRAQAEEERVKPLLETCLPLLDWETFLDCERALAPGAGKVAGIRAAGRLTAALRPMARRSRFADVRLKLWRRILAIGRRVTRRRLPAKRLVGGGALIAIVGADGAGKSTAVEALGEKLGKNFDVTRAHLGKPPRSRTTAVLITAARARGALLRLRRLIGAQAKPPRATESAILATSLARDRCLAVRRVRRIATNGGIVICDRFPLRQLTLMDGPRVTRVMNPRRFSRLTARLAKLERGYYAAIMPPDLLVVLRVDPEVAVARKPEEPADFVRARWSEIWEVNWADVPAHVIDAGQPREAVLAELEQLVWSEL